MRLAKVAFYWYWQPETIRHSFSESQNGQARGKGTSLIPPLQLVSSLHPHSMLLHGYSGSTGWPVSEPKQRMIVQELNNISTDLEVQIEA